MKATVEPCLRVHVLSASSLPRGGGGGEGSSWFVQATVFADEKRCGEDIHRTKPSRLGIWHEEVIVRLEAGDAQCAFLRFEIVDAAAREGGFKGCTLQLADLVPWNGYHLDINMGRDVRLRVFVLLVIEDPMVQIQHLLHLEAFLLTFPEGMPLPGVQREAGATIRATVRCIPKVTDSDGSMRASMFSEASTTIIDANDDKVVELDTRAPRQLGQLPCLWSTLPVQIVDDQVTWEDSIEFPIGRKVKKAYMSHLPSYPPALYGKGDKASECQVCFVVSFFVIEAPSQTSTALGFATLNVPDDVRLTDSAAELSADVVSPQGAPLGGVVCVVDLKATGPPPQPAGETELPEGDEGRDDSSSFTGRSGSRDTSRDSGKRSRSSSRERMRLSPRSKRRQQAMHAQVEELKEQVQILRTETERKDKIVDRLSEEIDKRSDAIKKCGLEILRLRKRSEALEKERGCLDHQLKALHRSAAEDEMEANRIVKAMEEGGSSHEYVGGGSDRRRLRAVAKRCIGLEESNRTLRGIAQEASYDQWQAAVLKTEMDTLKRTQRVQAMYIRKMQALPGKVSAYKSTVSMQEKVIEKLEARARPGRSQHEDTDSQSRRHENERLRKENAGLRWRLAMLGSKKYRDEYGGDDLNIIVAAKDAKIRVLEEQMVANAQAAGDEASRLKMRVMELEMGIVGPPSQSESRPGVTALL